jgi:outer membrane protein OmpA-like peptidoglycan-associated protein
MIKTFLTGLILIFISHTFVLGQEETYSVTLSKFSSKRYNEFSPVSYKKGIVFCTNRSPSLFLNYSNSQNKKPYKIYFIAQNDKMRSGSSKLFAKGLKSKTNDGPVSFNSRGDTIYYSRNMELSGKKKNSLSPGNKLGIFSAVLVNGQWTKVREFRYNDKWYNVTTPCLSPDGKKFFFASDKPNGSGGFDLYYCKWIDDYWSQPVNLGPTINTPGNESYPFINPSGDLFFSSDGQPGLGGMDIFYSQHTKSGFLPPVRLDAPVNSSSDDFGIISDSLLAEGYFSSNRNNSIDIYNFKTKYSQIFYTTIQKENQYYINFRDNEQILTDTSRLKYMWSFGDGEFSGKFITNHIYENPGIYNVKLDIIDKNSGKLFFSKLSYNLEISDFKRPYISSPDNSVKGEIITFDGHKSYLPGFRILLYSWDFGDGNRSSGNKVRHSYKKKGIYKVSLGLTIKSDSSGKIQKAGISKEITVFDNRQESASSKASIASQKTKLPEVMSAENVQIKTQYSAEDEFQDFAVFVIQLVTSKNKMNLKDKFFKSIAKKYTISERYDSTGGYSYTVDQQINLMATYPSYRELLALGFKDIQVKMYILKDQAEKELHNLIKTNGAFADSYFDSADRMTSNALIMLDQIVKLMKKHTSMKLEIAVHTDNSGLPENNLMLSKKHSIEMVNYLVKRGINAKRLVAMGFGGIKPVASNLLEKDRKLNRRIDFRILI